jgi:hypothetical protein
MKSQWKKAAAKRVPEPAPAATPKDRSWRTHVLPAAALCALALVAYSNSFGTGFPFDNGTIILKDARVHSSTPENLHLIWTQEYWYGSTTTGLYRPLTTLSYLFNYTVLGNRDHPAAYHVINFVLHAVNLLLVYILGLIVFRNRIAALSMAALWGVHPILTESVTNIVGRADLLAALGVLGGLLCYIQNTRTGKALWLAAGALVVLIGMFSKESAIVVIAIIVLYDLAFAKLRPLAYVAIVAPILVYLYVRYGMLSNLGMGVVPFGDNPLTGAGLFTAEMTAITVIGRYLWLLLWPAHLSSDYSYNQVPLFSWSDWQGMLAIVAVLAVLGMAVWAFRRNRTVFFFIAFFFVAIAPTSNLLVRTGTIMAERFLYLPAVAFAGCLVIAIQALSRKPAAAQIAVAILCLVYAGRAFARNFDWRDDQTLWASAARNSPDSFKPHLILAEQWLAKPGGLERAIQEVDRAVAIVDPLPDDRNVVRVYTIAGSCYRLKGENAKALALLLRGQKIDLAMLETVRRDYAARGRIVYPSGWPPLYQEIARTDMALHEPRKAVDALEYAVVLRPDPEFFSEMAQAWSAAAEPDRAATALMEGMALNPEATQLGAELADLYRKTAPQSCALTPTGINMECPLVHAQVCAATNNAAQIQDRRGHRVEASAMRASAARDLGCR